MSDGGFKWVVLAGCWLLYFVFGLSVTSLAPLVGEITADLNLSRADMGLVLGAWQFVYIFLAIPVGFALQRLGAGRMLILAALIIAVSGIGRSLADSHWAMLAAVAMFGLGGPVVSAGVPQTVSKWFAGSQRGLAMGVYITAPPIAGIVTYSLTQSVLLPALGDWRAVLRLWAICSVFAGVAWLLIWLAGRKIARKQAGTDDAPRAYRLADAAGLLSHRNTWLLLGVGAGVFTIDHGLRNWLPEILRSSGLSAEQAGYMASIAVVCGVIGALVFPAMAVARWRRQVLMTMFVMSAAGCLLLQGWSYPLLVSGLVLTGAASGAMMTISILALIEQDYVGPERAGIAGGIFFSFAEIGGVSGPVMLGLLHDYTGGFTASLYLLASLGLVLCGLVHLLQPSRS
ncbi:MAG: MFS transporter [Anderseniella sp.]